MVLGPVPSGGWVGLGVGVGWGVDVGEEVGCGAEDGVAVGDGVFWVGCGVGWGVDEGLSVIVGVGEAVLGFTGLEPLFEKNNKSTGIINARITATDKTTATVLVIASLEARRVKSFPDNTLLIFNF